MEGMEDMRTSPHLLCIIMAQAAGSIAPGAGSGWTERYEVTAPLEAQKQVSAINKSLTQFLHTSALSASSFTKPQEPSETSCSRTRP